MTPSHLRFPSSCYAPWTVKNADFFLFSNEQRFSLAHRYTPACQFGVAPFICPASDEWHRGWIQPPFLFAFQGSLYVRPEERLQCSGYCCWRTARGRQMQNHHRHPDHSEHSFAWPTTPAVLPCTPVLVPGSLSLLVGAL